MTYQPNWNIYLESLKQKTKKRINKFWSNKLNEIYLVDNLWSTYTDIKIKIGLLKKGRNKIIQNV